jgi:hypothetical protein
MEQRNIAWTIDLERLRRQGGYELDQFAVWELEFQHDDGGDSERSPSGARRIALDTLRSALTRAVR